MVLCSVELNRKHSIFVESGRQIDTSISPTLRNKCLSILQVVVFPVGLSSTGASEFYTSIALSRTTWGQQLHSSSSSQGEQRMQVYLSSLGLKLSAMSFPA